MRATISRFLSHATFGENSLVLASSGYCGMDQKPALGRLTPYSPNLLEDAFSEVCTELWLVASCPSLERVVTRRGKSVRKERGENAGRLPGASNLLNEHSLTAIPLILAFISFAIGATLPVVGEKGNIRIFTLPVREQLLAVADNAVVWRWANIFMGAAAI